MDMSKNGKYKANTVNRTRQYEVKFSWFILRSLLSLCLQAWFLNKSGSFSSLISLECEPLPLASDQALIQPHNSCQDNDRVFDRICESSNGFKVNTGREDPPTPGCARDNLECGPRSPRKHASQSPGERHGTGCFPWHSVKHPGTVPHRDFGCGVWCGCWA